MQILANNPQHSKVIIQRIVADWSEATVEVKADASIEKDAVVLQVSEGRVQGYSAAARYIAQAGNGKLLGSTAVEKSQVDQWISWANAQLIPNVRVVAKAVFGSAETTKTAYTEANNALKACTKTLNTVLEGRQFLVGNSWTLADVIVLQVLKVPLQTVLDAGFRKGTGKNVEAWALRYYGEDVVVKHEGRVQLAAKPLKPVLIEEKKPEKKP